MAKKLRTTTKGRAIFPRLSGEPDTKFNKLGVWSVKLAQSGAEGAQLIADIEAARKEALAEAEVQYQEKTKEYKALTPKQRAGKKPPEKPKMADAPYFVDEESGDVTFTFKLTASGETKDKKPFTQKPALFDASGKPIKGDIKIGGGSVIRVSYELNTFVAPIGAGASLRLKGVQIIELIEFGGDATYYGFEPEEGGFASEDAAEETFPADESEESAASTTGDASDEF